VKGDGGAFHNLSLFHSLLMKDVRGWGKLHEVEGGDG
jgi:hypothetical protein